MEIARIFLSSAAEIAVGLIAVMLLTALLVRAADKMGHPYLAPMLMVTFLAIFVLAGPEAGPVGAMILTFGVASTLLLLLWIKLSPDTTAPSNMNQQITSQWSYPALIAAVGEMRPPSRRELRLLLTRLKVEVRADELTRRSKAALIKRLARISLRSA